MAGSAPGTNHATSKASPKAERRVDTSAGTTPRFNFCSVGTVRQNGNPNGWVYLAVAGLFEIVWAIALKYADGFTRLWPSAIAIIGMILSVICWNCRCATCRSLLRMPFGRESGPLARRFWG